MNVRNAAKSIGAAKRKTSFITTQLYPHIRDKITSNNKAMRKGKGLLAEAFTITRSLIWKKSRNFTTTRKSFGAGNEARTRDLNLGKVALYQLSYSRVKESLERETRLELATSTLARLRSTN